MRGFHSKEWPWEFSFGQTRLRSKAGILFSVGSGRRFAPAPALSQASAAYLLLPLPAPRIPEAGPRGGGAGWAPRANGMEMPWGRPSGPRERSRRTFPKPALQTPTYFLSSPTTLPPPLLAAHPVTFWARPSTAFPSPYSTSSVTSVSHRSGRQYPL